MARAVITKFPSKLMGAKVSHVKDAAPVFAGSHLPIAPLISALNANGHLAQNQKWARIGSEIEAVNALPAKLYACI
jgi:hypothetical protein